MRMKTGNGISSKIKSKIDGRKYIISTAKDPHEYWQLAVFKVLWEIPYVYGKTHHEPLRISNFRTFEEAEFRHFEMEDFVTNYPIEFWQNSSFSKEQDITAKADMITEYLDSLKQSEEKQKEIIKKMWTTFEEKPYDQKILRRKALLLAPILEHSISIEVENILEIGNSDAKSVTRTLKKNFISPGELFVEIASVYLSFIDRFAFSVLSSKSREVFIDTLQDELIALSLLKHYGENADIIMGAFISDLNTSIEKYGSLPFMKNGNESPKGTVMWEFANNVGRIIGIEKHALFKELVMHKIIRDISILQLETLLPKRQDLAR